ncbi:hypothetical protein ACRAWF_26605 [Streptomyces sp. L7]
MVFEIEDRALLLMDPTKRDRLNELLRNPSHADIADQVRKGSLGLITAAKIATKYGLEVWLSMNPTGGTTANVVVPNQYLVPTAPVIGTVSLPAAPRPARQPAQASAPGQPPLDGRPVAPAAQGGADSAGPLPKRRREQRPMPSGQGPAVPSPAANPGR